MGPKRHTNAFFIVIVLLLTGALGFVVMKNQNTEVVNTEKPIEQPTVPVEQEEKSNSRLYEDYLLGIKVEYPNDIFVQKEIENGILLESAHSLVENFSGEPEGEFTHTFSIAFELKEVPLLELIEQEFGFVFLDVFPSSTQESFLKIDGFSSKITIDEKEGFSFISGIEGINTKHVFLAKTKEQTLVIAYNYIGDFLKPQLTEKEQKEIFNSVISTLEFITNQS